MSGQPARGTRLFWLGMLGVLLAADGCGRGEKPVADVAPSGDAALDQCPPIEGSSPSVKGRP
ncbi:MAG: hypothetical protein ACYSTY_04885 [Planctomycetota bacterium]|jgi:hypothetical protein